MTALALIGLLILFLLLGIPVAIALGLSSIIIIVFLGDSLAVVALKFFENLSGHYTFLAIPFFILSSSLMSTGGIAKRLIRFAMALLGHIKGGLAMASVAACMLFAAVSGSSPATVAAIGSIVIVGMVRAGYPQEFAAGVITTAGTLGILIPPSIVMLVYSAATEVSAAKMFMAGVIPGILMGLILIVAIYFIARIKDFPASSWAGFREIIVSAGSACGGLMLIFIVLGSIYGGIASPTEAAAVSAVAAFLLVTLGYRDIGPVKGQPWIRDRENIAVSIKRNTQATLLALPRLFTHPEVNEAIINSVKLSIMLLFVIANAMLFSHVLTSERIPHLIAELIISWGLPPWGFLVIVNILLLAAGNFMEPSAIILILAPILFPIATQLGIDPIHLGIIMVVNMEIGLITPPVGLNLFVTSGITGQSLAWVIRATLPWLGLTLLFLFLVTYIPQISLWLPELMETRRH